MSNTSTAFDDHSRNIKNCTGVKNTIKKANYAESLITRKEINKDTLLIKMSNEKVLDELSSFIAEFSYLTDGQDSKTETTKSPIRSYNAYLVKSSENNESLFNKTVRKRPHRNNNYIRRRKSVEWIDQTKPYIDHKTNVKFYSETPDETSEVERHYIPREQRDTDYVLKQLKKRSPNYRKKIKPRDDESTYIRPRSRVKRLDERKVIGRFRVESNGRNKKIPHPKIKVKKSKTPVRYWPFRYEKKKTRYKIAKHPLVRKENCIPIERKFEILRESPTVITLYPENAKRKHFQIKIDELEFLADPNLPCKCFKCMRKYELLQQISNDELNINNPCCKPVYKCQSMSKCYDDVVSHPRTRLKQPEMCVCKKVRSSYTFINPKSVNQNENSSFYPHSLQFIPECKNKVCCRNNEKNFVQFCNNCWEECSKKIDCCKMPPNQICLPKQIEENCCRPCQFYKPYSNFKYHNLKPCHYPCDEDHLISNWNLNEIGSCDEQNGDTRYKSVYFRFDCLGHQINPAVTQYFHSILNNKIHDSCL